MATGEKIVQLARRHLGERYIFGAVVPKDNPHWTGPWDCAEFASWLVFQAAGKLYGCDRDSGDPATADAYTGFWARDARKKGQIVSLEQAARTPGAAVLRLPKAGAIGHIAICDGRGGTVEAHSTRTGVITHTVSGRRWDMGILAPGIGYSPSGSAVPVAPPARTVFRLKTPPMAGPVVKEIQQKLKAAGFDPGPLDGSFGPKTHAAVVAVQLARGLVADGEVGPRTAHALKITLPHA